MPEIVASIITARGGSTRLPHKHTLIINGRRLTEYPLAAAQHARYVQAHFLATDDQELADIARGMDTRVLDLSPELCSDGASQTEALVWASGLIRKEMPTVSIIVALLGNTSMIDKYTVDQVICVLCTNPHADSAMTVWQAEDDHPLRGMYVGPQGYLRSYLDNQEYAINSQTYPDVYYHDQGVWAFRVGCLDKLEGPRPWVWMGKKCLPVVRPWWAGRDVDTDFDVEIAEYWATTRGNNEHRPTE